MESIKFVKKSSNKGNNPKNLEYIKNRANRIITTLSSIIIILFIIVIYLFLNINSKKCFIKELIEENNNLKIKHNNTIEEKSITNINDSYYFTLKNQFYRRFEKVFLKYRKEAELSEEYRDKLKKDILNGYSSLYNKQYTTIDTIIFNKKLNLGNALFAINNYIYYCEILGCKNLYLSNDYWFIKKPIYDKELDINISPFNINNTFNKETTLYIEKKTNFDESIKTFSNNIIPIRTYILKDEILSNVKLIDTNDEDLIINIRSGEDVFSKQYYSPESYHQPPLCFYQTIIETFNFTNIYIISNGKENPVINELLKIYNNIKFMHGTEEEDVRMILSAKNLVLATSSFPIELVKLNDNVKNVFFYDFLKEEDKFLWHFKENNLRPLKYNLFVMYPTKEYVKIMNPWRKQDAQFNQMIKEKCNKKFRIIPSYFV